jgi:iron complex outermembrane receptor protein
MLVHNTCSSFSCIRKPLFPIRQTSTVAVTSLCAKYRKVRHIFTAILLATALNATAQNNLNTISATTPVEQPAGVISGQIKTSDDRPAAYVSVYLKESNKVTMTDENGFFSLRNIKEGVYTLEITMVGLKPQQKVVELKKDQVVTISVALAEDTRQLTEVVVATGRRLNNRPIELGKIAINPMDLPQAITVIGQGMIREQQAQRLSDVIRNVNGVYLTTTRGNVQESFAARGYGFGSNNLFKNGARINTGSMPEMSSLERVEVLKGSSAILFGQVAPGGVINMVTKEPKFNFGGEVSMRVGSYDLYKPAFDVYGPMSKSVAYRLNGTFESANSFRDGVSSTRYYVNPSFLFKLGTKTEFVVEGDYLNHKFTPDFGTGTINNTVIADVPRNRFFGTPWQYNNTQQTTGTATLRHNFSDSWKINASASYQYFTRDYYGVERVAASANGDWNRTLGRVLTFENYYTAQANLVGKFKTGKVNHDLLAGVDVDRYKTLNNDFSFPAVAGLPAAGYDRINLFDPGKFVPRTDVPKETNIRKRVAPVNRFGAYIQDLVKITSKWNVLAGIRWSYVETVAIDSTNTLTGATVRGTTRTDKAFSPRFGVVYKPTTSTSVFASYSNSFVVNTGWDIDGKPVEPSLIDQYEIGIKNEFFKGLLSANLTLYRIKNNNLAQTAQFLRDGTANNNSSIKELTGGTLSDGVEIDLASHPIKGLDITAGYSYNFARVTAAGNTTGSQKVGEKLVNNPNHTANATAFYTFHNNALNGLKLGISALYMGDRYAGWNNTVGQSQNFSRLIFVNGYTTVDVTAGYNFKKYSVLAKVSNITNTLNYTVHENYSVNPIAPTQFVATVSYRF